MEPVHDVRRLSYFLELRKWNVDYHDFHDHADQNQKMKSH